MRVKTALYVFVLIITVNLLMAKPDFAKIARAFGKGISINEQQVHGHIDRQGKLWVVARKWHTEKVVVGGGGGAVILPDGRVVQSPPPQYDEMPTFPYLYLWLYDSSGNKIKEGTLGDSIQYVKMLSIDNGMLLFYIYYEPDPSGFPIYCGVILFDENGTVIANEKIADEKHWPWQVNQRRETVYLTLSNTGRTYVVNVRDNEISVEDGPEFRYFLTPDRRTFEILEIIDPLVLFGWTRVDTATQFVHDAQGQVSWNDYILLTDKIQIAECNLESQTWDANRYTLSDVSFRKYEGFDLYRLRSTPSVEEYPEVQSVRSEDGSIVVTVLLNENSQAVAYQMLFDSLGTLVPFEKVESLTPRGIDDIPNECEIFIKREAGRGRWKNSKVWIWGYDKEEAQLYWTKYTIAID